MNCPHSVFYSINPDIIFSIWIKKKVFSLETLKNKKIAVLKGGISSEREISLQTGNAVLKALKNKGFDAVDIDIDRNAAESIKLKIWSI